MELTVEGRHAGGDRSEVLSSERRKKISKRLALASSKDRFSAILLKKSPLCLSLVILCMLMGWKRIAMMGQLDSGRDKLFYSFNLDNHVPRTHLLRGIDHFLDLGDLRQHLAPFYNSIGRPSIDP